MMSDMDKYYEEKVNKWFNRKCSGFITLVNIVEWIFFIKIIIILFRKLKDRINFWLLTPLIRKINILCSKPNSINKNGDIIQKEILSYTKLSDKISVKQIITTMGEGNQAHRCYFNHGNKTAYFTLEIFKDASIGSLAISAHELAHGYIFDKIEKYPSALIYVLTFIFQKALMPGLLLVLFGGIIPFLLIGLFSYILTFIGAILVFLSLTNYLSSLRNEHNANKVAVKLIKEIYGLDEKSIDVKEIKGLFKIAMKVNRRVLFV